MRIIAFLFTVWFVPALPAQRASLPGRHYTIRDGLAQQQVRTFFEDSRGYLWIGANGGLTRFDGRQLTPYSPAEGFPGRQIYSIMEAPDGALWYQSAGQVFRFDGRTDSLLPMTPDFWVRQPHRYWPLLTVTFRELLGDTYPELASLSSQTLVFTDTSGAVLVADAVNRTMFRFSGGSWQRLPPLPPEVEGELSIDNTFRYLFASYACFAWINGRLVKVAEVDASTQKPRVLHSQAPGVYNFNTNGTRAFFYRRGDVYLPFEPGAYNRLHSVYQDRNSRLLVATDEGLVVAYLHGPEVIDVPGARYPWGVLSDGNGGIFLSSYEDGVFYIHPEREILKKYSLPASSDNKHQLFPGTSEGSGGTRLFGGYKAVYFLTSGRLQALSTGESVEATAYDALRRRFVVAGKNLYAIDEISRTVREKKAIPDVLLGGEPARDVAVDAGGSLWLCGKGGTGIFTDRLELTQHHVLRTEKGQTDEGRSLLVDSSGVLWAGGNLGLYRFDQVQKQWRHVATKYVTNPVNSLAALPGGRLAVVTDRSVVLLDIRRTPEVLEVYDDQNGYVLLEPSENGACFDGRYLWIPAGNGLQRIAVASAANPPARAAVYIDRINDCTIPLNEPARYSVSNQDYATLKISVVNPPPGGLQVFFRVNDGPWTPFDSPTATAVVGLTHGDNIVWVQLRGQAGVSAETSCVITVRLPYYQRAGYRWGFGLIALGVFTWLFFRVWRQHRLKANLEMSKLHALQAQMNPHVLFNLLSSLQNAIVNRSKEEAQQNLIRLAGMMREVLEFSFPKNPSGRKPFSTITLAREMDFLGNYLSLEALQTDPPFHFTVENATGLAAEDINLPPMLVQPLVENAVLHGVRKLRGRQGDIRVVFRAQGTTLAVEVTDNGVGLQARQGGAGDTLRYRSRGGQMLKERLYLIQKLGYPATLNHIPREDGGTIAVLKLEHMI